MAEEKNNSHEPDWAELLDLLENNSSQAGELTEKQKQQLAELRALMSETSDALTVYSRLDVNRSWSDLRTMAQKRGLIEQEGVLSGHYAVRRLWFRVLVAASLFIALSLGGYYFYRQLNQQEELVIAVDADIQPGGNKAILVLSDGQSIALRSDQKGIAVAEDGIYYPDGRPLSGVDNVTYATLEVPRGGQYQLTLPDGTKVWLNADSRLTYPTAFQGDERVVKLQGEGYFEVSPNKRKPFFVQGNGHKVKVLGTSFNIQSYTDAAQSRVTLVEGSVQIHSDAGMAQMLRPNEQAVISADELSVRRVDAQQYVVWKDGIIVLDKQDIRSIIPQLERWYDVEFSRSGIPKHTSTLSGEIPRDISLSAVLDVLGEQLKLKFEIKGRRVMVKD